MQKTGGHCEPEEMNSDGIDRISSLPDPILSHILSSLSTKEAVQTCVLSKRWTRVWASMPVLKFDCHVFEPDDNKPDALMDAYENKFAQFVKGVLQNREALSLDKFELQWNAGLDSPFKIEAVREFILYATRFKPRVLFANVNCGAARNMEMDSIFTCISLQDVSLQLNTKLRCRPNSITLPCLKKLEVSSLHFCDGDMDMLFVGCPVLEELWLNNCNLEMAEISSKSLKKLVIYKCLICGKNGMIQISTPNLLYLEIRNALPGGGISLRNMPSLVDAYIDYPFWFLFSNDVGTASEFLSCLSNVTSLDLILFLKLEIEGFMCITFNNLKSLTLRMWHGDEGSDFIPLFLHSAPNLQKLTLTDIHNEASKDLFEGERLETLRKEKENQLIIVYPCEEYWECGH